MQSEVLTLTLSQLDLEAGTLRLEPGTTKNADGRLVYLTPELQTLLSAALVQVGLVGCCSMISGEPPSVIWSTSACLNAWP